MSDSKIWAVNVVALLAVSLAGLFVLIEKDKNEWEAFRVTHNCRPTAGIKGDRFNIFGLDSTGSVSVGVASTLDKTRRACDDGVTYYRGK
jgi:hypothetical protein